jgi:glycosyltransferase involved in cell wall biosynthesis
VSGNQAKVVDTVMTGADQGHARRVLIAAPYASERSGGAAALPLGLFTRLRARAIETWLVTHESARAELTGLLPASELRRVVFAPGLHGFGLLSRWRTRLPSGLRTIAWGITQVERQVAMVPVIRRLVQELAIDVVHQPVSVSPVIPSPLRRLGAPVVMGPLDGGMELPPAFSSRDSAAYAMTKAARPIASRVLNQLIRGRLDADAVLIANARTRRLLPSPARENAIEEPEIWVDLAAWPLPAETVQTSDDLAAPAVTRFLFVGRLVNWKAVDILLDAFAEVRRGTPARLDIVGDGRERTQLAAQARRLSCDADVVFHGWLSPLACARQMRDCDVFVSAALQEAGGMAVLEAMASGRPVVATAWGGHLHSVTDTTGILVDVSSRDALVRGLVEAMTRLARDPDLRSRLGAAGRRRVEERYDVNLLIDRRLRAYDRVCAARRG